MLVASSGGSNEDEVWFTVSTTMHVASGYPRTSLPQPQETTNGYRNHGYPG